jgi:hypothetical protein
MRAEQERFVKATLEALQEWWADMGALAWIGLGLVLLAAGVILSLGCCHLWRAGRHEGEARPKKLAHR